LGKGISREIKGITTRKGAREDTKKEKGGGILQNRGQLALQEGNTGKRVSMELRDNDPLHGWGIKALSSRGKRSSTEIRETRRTP